MIYFIKLPRVKNGPARGYNIPMAEDIEGLRGRVKRNCDISDAVFWGYYSICGLLMRLREQYRFENGIRPWQTVDVGKVSDWIEKREALWKELEEEKLAPVEAGSEIFDPFDSEGINGALEKSAMLYGAGYGLFMKPMFFLADLAEKYEIEGHRVCVSGREYARDLSLHPAMLQGRNVFARSEVVKSLLWDKYHEMTSKLKKGALSFAFSHYGVGEGHYPPERLDRLLGEAARAETRSYVWHEIGESFEGMRLGPEWESLLSETAGGKASVYVRAVKDVLSDTSEKGMLKYIVESKNPGSLAFYALSLGGYRKALSSGIEAAFDKFISDGNWEAVDRARALCYLRLKETAEELLSLYRLRKGDPSLPDEVQGRFMRSI